MTRALTEAMSCSATCLQRRVLLFFQDGAGAEGEEAEEEEEEDENSDVLYEADVMQDQRILDVDDVRVFGSKALPGKGGKLRIVNPFAFSGVTEDGFQFQKPERLKKKLKRIMVFELSRKDVMPDERANAVSNKKVFQKEKASNVVVCSDHCAQLLLASSQVCHLN